MSEISNQANAIVLAASTRMVALCQKASENLVNGIESRKQFTQSHKILTLLKAYQHAADMNAYESDALLYCLKQLSDASSFPTTNPIVGQIITSVIQILGGGLSFYNQGTLLGSDITQIDFREGVLATKVGARLTVTPAIGAVILVGDWDASVNSFPITGGTAIDGSIKKGNEFNIPIGGILADVDVGAGATIRAKKDNPGQTWADWRRYD